MINLLTLKPHYPHVPQPLSAIQLISMHLFIWRPQSGDDSDDPLFGPYISILPRDISDHPLMRLVQSKYLEQPETANEAVLQTLPPSVFAELKCVYGRFLDDWVKVHSCLVRNLILPEWTFTFDGLDTTLHVPETSASDRSYR